MELDILYLLVMALTTASVMYVVLAIPSYGTSSGTAKRMRTRISRVMQDLDQEQLSILRKRQLEQSSPADRLIAQFPGGERLLEWIEQSGSKITSGRLMLLSAAIGLPGFMIVYSLTNRIDFSAATLVFLASLPTVRVFIQRGQRITKFEEQLPDALDIMTRALRAGHSFNESLGLVGEELEGPVPEEFRRAYADINYGMNIELVFLDMLRRVPSVSLQALTTAVLIQRQVGGNTAEILSKIAEVVRGRFRFKRKVKTLTAEGRMSGWVLAMVPFALAAMLLLVSPDYLGELKSTETGRELIMKALVLELIGVLWIRRLLKMDV
jgi:tight adherence protein B